MSVLVSAGKLRILGENYTFAPPPPPPFRLPYHDMVDEYEWSCFFCQQSITSCIQATLIKASCR